VFEHLEEQDPAVLLEYLQAAYDEMDTDQRRTVFGEAVKEARPSAVDGEELLAQVEVFRDQSLAGAYYASFEINSKNFMHVPEETNEWFERLGDLLQDSSRLTKQGDHAHAVACFRVLYEVIDAMERGEEIVFGDEIGSWMIPGDEKQAIADYMSSLAATSTPEEFAAAALPLIRRDSYHSFADKAYASANRAANKAQKAKLKSEIQRQGVRTKRKS